MLSAYQQQAGGKIKVTSVNSQSNAGANAALTDGLSAFNQDKGDACYLGVALMLNGKKETLPRLSPEWEQALEPDLTRAIARLLDATRPFTSPTAMSHINTNALQEVKALIPDLAAVSVAPQPGAKRRLRRRTRSREDAPAAGPGRANREAQGDRRQVQGPNRHLQTAQGQRPLASALPPAGVCPQHRASRDDGEEAKTYFGRVLISVGLMEFRRRKIG